jgi:hypothetical protein
MAKFKPKKHDFTMYKNTTHDEIMRFRDNHGNIIDLTGSTARMEIKTDITDVEPLHTLTTENGGLIIDVELGKLIIHVDTVDETYAGKYDIIVWDSSGDKQMPIAPSKIKVVSVNTSLGG